VVILNEYLEEMAEVVVGECDAYVDKYIGDAIMAFWNAPIEQPDHALRACRAAWRCQIRLGEIQAHLASLGLDAGDEGLVMRVGVNTGPAVVGLMGSSRKLNYTVMGDTVNTASRLEGANKPYGSRIMIAESTRLAAGPAVKTRVLDLLKVKGKAEPTKVYELIGYEGLGAPLYDEAYVAQYHHEAFGHYQKGNFGEAQRVFTACLQKRPKDTVSQLYLHRCEEFIKHPPESWDGVYVMKTK
jgi:adenylate cyclase